MAIQRGLKCHDADRTETTGLKLGGGDPGVAGSKGREMSLVKPEDREVVQAITSEFLKIAQRAGVSQEQALQAMIAVSAALIREAAGKDRKYALELFGRYKASLLDSILSQY